VVRCPTRTGDAFSILIPNDLALSRGAASAARSSFLQSPCGAVGCSGLLGSARNRALLRYPPSGEAEGAWPIDTQFRHSAPIVCMTGASIAHVKYTDFNSALEIAEGYEEPSSRKRGIPEPHRCSLNLNDPRGL